MDESCLRREFCDKPLHKNYQKIHNENCTIGLLLFWPLKSLYLLLIPCLPIKVHTSNVAVRVVFM